MTCACGGVSNAAVRWRLTPEDVAHATAVGQARYDESIKSRRRDRLGENNVQSHIDGALGELAFCRVMVVPWPARLNTFHRVPDVDPDYEVRWAARPLLKIRPAEVLSTEGWPMLRDRRFVLVTREDDSYLVWGWLHGRAAVGLPRADPGARGKPAYFIPPEYLHRFPVHQPQEAAA